MQLVFGDEKYINNFLLDKNLDVVFNEFGKPFDKNNKYFFNKSNANDLSVCIIDDKMYGIDIEEIKEYNARMVNKICSIEEKVFLSNINNKDYYFTLLWVLKECYLKCIGIGFSVPLKNINFVCDNRINLNYDGCDINYFTLGKYIVAICRKDK